MTIDPRLRSPRRILTALCIAVLLGGTGWTVLGVAGAADDSDDARPMAAVAHSRDRWSYDVVLDGAWSFGDDDEIGLGRAHPAALLVWDGVEDVRLSDGEMHRAAVLRESVLDYWPFGPLKEDEDVPDHRWSVDNRSSWHVEGAVGAYDAMVGRASGYAAGGLYLPEPVDTPLLVSGTRSNVILRDTHFDARMPCLAVQPTGAARLGEQIRIPACTGGFFGIEEGVAVTAAGMDAVAGINAVRYESENLGLLGAQRMTVWFHPEIAYPVQWWFQVESDGKVREATLTITGLDVAGDALPVPDAPAYRDPAPELEDAALQPWGIDDTGVSLPFLPSEAFQRARDDAQWTRLRDYLDDHPDAVTVHAHPTYEERVQAFAFYERPSGYSHSWRFVLSDGEACFSFRAEMSQETPVEPFPRPEPTYRFFSHDDGMWGAPCDDETWHFPGPMQATAPSAASLLAMWEAYASAEEREEGPNGWSFRWQEGEEGPVLDIQAGQAASYAFAREEGAGYAYSSGPGPGGSLLLLDGEAYAYRHSVAETEGFHQIGPAGTPAETRPDGAVLSDAGLDAPLAALPVLPGAAVATISLSAILLGFLYWAWPALKGAPAMGLFSRVRRNRVLDHPVRAQVMDAITAEPGIHYQQLVRRTGLSKGQVEHHLQKLVEVGLVVRREGSGYTCHFPAGRLDASRMDAVAVLKAPGARAVLAAVQRVPGCSAGLVGQQAGLAPATVHRHIGRLVEAGLLERRRAARGAFALHATGLATRVAAA